MKKCLSFLIYFALVINTVAPVFAMDSNTGNSSNGIEYVEGGFEKLPELSDEEIEWGIEKALQMQLAEIKDVKERKEVEVGIRQNLEKIQVSVTRQNFETLHVSYSKQGRSLGDIWNKLVPDIHIKNKHVAGTINAIITGVAFAAGAGSLSLALKKYGAKQLKVMFTKTLKKRVIRKTAIALGISIPAIASFLDYVIDPVAKMAAYLDSKDKKPNNGYLDVIW